MATHDSDSRAADAAIWTNDTECAEPEAPHLTEVNPEQSKATNAQASENEADQVAGAASKAKNPRKKPEYVKFMVTLRGLGEGEQDAGASVADRRARYANMRTRARERQVAVLAWLQEKGVQDQFRRVSNVTAFGTFTMEATAAVAKMIGRAPQVESVIAASDAPMELLHARK